MDAIESLTKFIEGVVLVEKQERYVGFLGSKKNRHKFLDTLDHDLCRLVDSSKSVDVLSESEWNSPGFLYSSDGTFGVGLSSLKAGYNQASPYGSWLIVSRLGDVAIFHPEGKIDDEQFFRI